MNVVEEATRLRKAGYNVIPIRAGTKEPPRGSSVMAWKAKPCEVEIIEGNSIAMLHGEAGGTWALDFDSPEIYEEIMAGLDTDGLMVVKTPKRGHHIIFGRMAGDVPPTDTSLQDKNGRKIDIKANGYTLLPPSTHPDKTLGRYQWVNTQDETKVTRWSAALVRLNACGFFLPGHESDEVDYEGKKWDYGVLVLGGYPRGSRRRMTNSYYCQKRNQGSSHEDAYKEALRVNDTCVPPIDDNEFRINMKAVQRWYEDTVLVGQDDTVPKKARKTKPKIDHYALAHKLMEDNIYLSHVSKEIYIKEGGVYRPGGDKEIRKKCRDNWEKINIKSRDILEIENIIREKNLYRTDDGRFDTHPYRLVLGNGDYDLETGEWHEGHDPATICMVKHDVEYDPAAACPRFVKFLESTLPDERSRGMILEMMAQCFLRQNVVQKGYVLHGIGSNGKTTLVNILREMVGMRNTCSLPMDSLQGNDFRGWEIFGKTANISGDGGTEPIKQTTLLKKLLGGDAIRCEGKYRDPFDFVPHCTMVFVHNELPMVHDSSDGFARKMQIIEFGEQFYGGNRDNSVHTIHTDMSELSGVMNMIIPIMQRIIRTRVLEYEDSVGDIKKNWLKRSDSVYHFTTECLELYPGGHVSVKEMKLAYQRMCQEEGMTALGDGVLSARLEVICGDKPKSKRSGDDVYKAWIGVRLKSG